LHVGYNIQEVVFLVDITLAEKIRKNFSKVRVKGAIVRVPKLNIKKIKASKIKKQDKTPVSSIVSILIKSSIESAKKERKEKSELEEDRAYRIPKEDAKTGFEGYGAFSRRYGASPHASYVDYGKLFSYLGKFRAQGAFENFASDNPTERINKIVEQGNKFYLIDNEVRDDAVRSIKYFTHGAVMGEQALPTGKINSADWEKFKIWKLVSYVEFNLKMQTL